MGFQLSGLLSYRQSVFVLEFSFVPVDGEPVFYFSVLEAGFEFPDFEALEGVGHLVDSDPPGENGEVDLVTEKPDLVLFVDVFSVLGAVYQDILWVGLLYKS